MINILKKYLAIVFVTASFMAAFHHHNDLKQHNDCQICVIQSNFSQSDTPPQPHYLTDLEIKPTSIIIPIPFLHHQKFSNTFQARAPPHIS